MSFARQILYVLSADAVMEGAQLALKSVIAVALGPTVFGVVTLIQFVPQYAEKLFRIGVDEGATYVASRNPERVGAVFFNTAFLVGIFGLAAILAFLGVEDLYFRYIVKTAEVTGAVLVAALASIPPLFLFRSFMKDLVYLENIRYYNALNFGIPLLGQALVLIAIALWGVNLFAMTMAPTIAYLCGSVIAGIVLYRNGAMVMRLDWSMQKQLIAYGTKVYLPSAVQFLQYRLDVLLIGALLTPAAVGFYSLAATFAQILYKLPNTVASLLYPKSARSGADGRLELVADTCRHTTTVVGVLLIPFAVAVELSVRWFLPAYLPILPAFRVLVVAWSIMGLAQLLHNYFLGQGKPQVSFAIFAVGLAVNVAANAFLIPFAGIVGAACASLLSYGLCSLLFVRRFIRESQYSWRGVMVPRRHDWLAYKRFFSRVYCRL